VFSKGRHDRRTLHFHPTGCVCCCPHGATWRLGGRILEVRQSNRLAGEFIPDRLPFETASIEKENCMNRAIAYSLLLIIPGALARANETRATEIADWNAIMFQALRAAGTSSIVTTRVAAIVQGAVFDAVNGIERRYTPVHVTRAAPGGASKRAAAVMAAYSTLVSLYPAQKPMLDQKLAASLAAIGNENEREHSMAIARGIEWGQTVAAEILDWRSTDGFTSAPPPFLGGTSPGEWRPTPPAFAPGAVPQFAYMRPWVIRSPSQFRPGGPPALGSTRYANDFNEVKLMGSATSATRTPEQTLYSQFWQSATANYLWNHVALTLAGQRQLSFSEQARLLAWLNMAIADGGIGVWDAKYHYSFWRPVTAIPLAASDTNPATTEDPNWTPLLVTPGFPEYPSAHSTVSSAAAKVLAHVFGQTASFAMTSDAPSMAGVVRLFGSFPEALAEVANARIFGGIHFRTATEDGLTQGTAIGTYVVEHALQPARGDRD
jgi:membrane-associated phospholipid phosphatase